MKIMPLKYRDFFDMPVDVLRAFAVELSGHRERSPKKAVKTASKRPLKSVQRSREIGRFGGNCAVSRAS
jgi:hypothetical protein